MDTKQLVDKFVSGEITEEQFDTETSNLSTEGQEALKKELDSRKPELEKTSKELLKEVVGLRQAKKSISEKTNDSLASKLKEENLETAKSKFFDEFKIEKDEDQKAFAEGFKSDAINVDNIIKDMKKHYVATNPDKYLELEKKQREVEFAAEEMNASNAGSNGSSGGGSDSMKKASKEVKDFIELTRRQLGRTLTVEEAEKRLAIVKNKGRID